MKTGIKDFDLLVTEMTDAVEKLKGQCEGNDDIVCHASNLNVEKEKHNAQNKGESKSSIEMTVKFILCRRYNGEVERTPQS